MLASITWDVDPEIFNLFGREVRWYGLLWALGISFTALVLQRIYKKENLSEKAFDSLFLYVLAGLIIGARLGHCLFYTPVYYLSNPIDLIKIWEGGLASHGGAIGMTIGVCLYSLKMSGNKVNWKSLGIWSVVGLATGLVGNFIIKSFLGAANSADAALSATIMGLCIGICISLVYTTREVSIRVLDRLVIGVAIGATSIRLGNLMNSEIYGGPTTLPWGFNFVRDPRWYELGLPCHPTQIYEALMYIAVFVLGLFMYYKTSAKDRRGLILGISLIGIFFSRFLIEFIKNIQEPFERDMVASFGINMGQLLSLPFVIWGGWLIWNALKAEPVSGGLTSYFKNIKK